MTKFGSRGKSESQSYGSESSDDSPWMSEAGREGEGSPTIYPVEALMRQTVGMQGLGLLQSTGRGKREAYEKGSRLPEGVGVVGANAMVIL